MFNFKISPSFHIEELLIEMEFLLNVSVLETVPQGKWVYSWVGYEGIKHILYHKNLCLLQSEMA